MTAQQVDPKVAKAAKVKQQMVKMAVLQNMRIKKRIVKQERQLKKQVIQQKIILEINQKTGKQ